MRPGFGGMPLPSPFGGGFPMPGGPGMGGKPSLPWQRPGFQMPMENVSRGNPRMGGFGPGLNNMSGGMMGYADGGKVKKPKADRPTSVHVQSPADGQGWWHTGTDIPLLYQPGMGAVPNYSLGPGGTWGGKGGGVALPPPVPTGSRSPAVTPKPSTPKPSATPAPSGPPQGVLTKDQLKAMGPSTGRSPVMVYDPSDGMVWMKPDGSGNWIRDIGAAKLMSGGKGGSGADGSAQAQSGRGAADGGRSAGFGGRTAASGGRTAEASRWVMRALSTPEGTSWTTPPTSSTSFRTRSRSPPARPPS